VKPAASPPGPWMALHRRCIPIGTASAYATCTAGGRAFAARATSACPQPASRPGPWMALAHRAAASRSGLHRLTRLHGWRPCVASGRTLACREPRKPAGAMDARWPSRRGIPIGTASATRLHGWRPCVAARGNLGSPPQRPGPAGRGHGWPGGRLRSSRVFPSGRLGRGQPGHREAERRGSSRNQAADVGGKTPPSADRRRARRRCRA